MAARKLIAILMIVICVFTGTIKFMPDTMEEVNAADNSTGTYTAALNDLLLYGSAKALADGSIELTPVENNRSGSAWYQKKISLANGFSTGFDYWAGGGHDDDSDGADGITIMFSGKTGIGGDGETLGFVEGDTYGVELDSYPYNDEDPNGKHIAIIKCKASNHLVYKLDDRVDDEQWHSLSVSYENNVLSVSLDGAPVLSSDQVVLSEQWYIGISAATGAEYNRHLIKNFFVQGDVAVAKGDSYIEYNGHAYARYDKVMNWNDAKEYCEKLGGHLVTITSQKEQSIVEKLIEKPVYAAYWLGGKFDQKWLWVTGEEFGYSNWARGEPNYQFEHIFLQMYTEKNGSEKGRWDDTSYDGDHGGGIKSEGFICEWEGGKNTSTTTGKEFKLGNNVEFTVPSNVSFIGGKKIKLNFDLIPVQFEREENYFRIGIGTNDLEKMSDEVWNGFKKYVETQKEEYRKGINSYIASKFGEATSGWNDSMKISCWGYAEGTISSDGIQWVAGKMVIEMKSKGSQEWQTIIVGFPVVVKFSIEVGIKATCSVGLDLSNSEVKIDGKLDMTFPKMKPSVGVGVSHIADISVYGSASNVISISSQNHLTATLKGEVGVSAKFFGISGEISLLSGELTYFDDWKKKIQSVSSESLMSETDFSDPDVWEIDDTTAAPWSGNADGILQAGVYGDAAPQLLQTSDGTRMLCYIAAVSGRAAGNQYAAVYSVYNEDTKRWTNPVVIDNDGTADFNIRAVAKDHKIYFVWCNAKEAVDEKDLTDNDSFKEAASLYEIEAVKLDAATGETSIYKVTDNQTFDYMSDLSADGDDIYISWCENKSNDMIALSGTNIVHMGVLSEGGFSELASREVSGPVAALNTGRFDGEMYAAYIYSEGEDSKIALLSADSNYWEVEGVDVAPDQVSISDLRGESSLLWSAQGESGTVLYAMTEARESMVLVEEEGVLISDYSVFHGVDGDMVVCATSSGEEGSCVSAYLVAESGKTRRVELCGQGGTVLCPTMAGKDDQYTLLYLSSTAEISGESMKTTTDLCVKTVNRVSDLTIDTVDYLEEEMVPGGHPQITVSVRNNGLYAAETAAVRVSCNGESVGDGSLTELPEGEEAEIEIPVQLPDYFDKNARLSVQLESNGTIVDSAESGIGMTDLGVKAEKNGDQAVITVSNDSAYDTSAQLLIYDTDETGGQLASYELGTVASGSEVIKTCDLNLFSAADTLLIAVTSEDEELFDFNNRTSLYVGEDVLKTLDYLTVSKSTTQYKKGDKLSIDDLSVSAVYTDGSSLEMTEFSTNASDIDMDTVGEKQLQITYEEVGMISTASISIDVVDSLSSEFLIGDANGDGAVNNKDVAYIARSIVGKEQLTEEQRTAADVNGDGTVNNKDVAKLARYLVGKETSMGGN